MIFMHDQGREGASFILKGPAGSSLLVLGLRNSQLDLRVKVRIRRTKPLSPSLFRNWENNSPAGMQVA